MKNPFPNIVRLNESSVFWVFFLLGEISKPCEAKELFLNREKRVFLEEIETLYLYAGAYPSFFHGEARDLTWIRCR